MTTKTVSSVIDDINEWNNPKGGTIYYVTCFFTDGDVGSVGRKDQDAALEVQGLLREAIGIEQDFTLESKGQTQSGKPRWAVKGFGTPGGAATYTAPAAQGSPGGGASSRPREGRSPEHDQFIQERMDRRTALMQAVQLFSPGERKEAEFYAVPFADRFYSWLRKTSGSSTPPIPDAAPGMAAASLGDPEPTSETGPTPAGGVATEAENAVSEDRGGVVEQSEGGSSDKTTTPLHQHDFYERQGIRNFLVCDCGATKKKEQTA